MNNAFTVTQINNLISSTLQAEAVLQNCLVQGTITNLKRHSSGHYYFSLKDEKSSVDVALFKQTSYNKAFVKDMENGLFVTIVGNVNFYAPWGKLTIICQDMFIQKKSPLQLEFEKLKKELQALGYFDESHKKQLPYMAKCIGIVTSSSGAVLHDILNVSKNRNPLVKFKLFAVPVQGNTAGAYIAKGIEMADEDNEVELIIVGRGGGSMEDLWCFNDRLVVEALYNAKKPTISAVGHETDFTLCDFAADVRSSTPSHAAELAVRAKTDLQYALQDRVVFLENVMAKKLKQEKDNLASFYNTKLAYPLLQFITKLQRSTAEIGTVIQNKMSNRLREEEKQLALMEQRLKFANPQNLLDKGFTRIEKDGKAVISIKDLKADDIISVPLQDGEIIATIKELNHE